jgi:VWFA-related protein
MFDVRSRNVVFVLLVAALAPTALASGQAPSDAGTTFKTRAELVTIPAVVTDKAGVHIQNLKKEDFIVLEDGVEQKIATFEEVQQPTNPVLRAPTQSNHFSNVLTGGAAPTRLTILVLDMINTPFQDQAMARQALVKFLGESLNGDQPIGLLVIRRSGMKVIQDFTTDPKLLIAAVQKLKGERQPLDSASEAALPPANDAMSQTLRRLMELERASEQEMESFERRSAVITTLQVMQQIAQSCAGLPRRKAMIWASAGFPFSINETSMVLKETGARLSLPTDLVPLYEKTWKALNQAQIALYPVDVRGLVNPSYLGAEFGRVEDSHFSHADWQHFDTLATFQTFADATGGRAFFNTNALNAAFQAASEDNASYYMLGYYLDRKDKKPGWHKLGVKLRHKEVKIRARSGYFLTKGGPEQNDKTMMETALTSPLAYTAIPITGQWKEVAESTEPGKKKIGFLLTMPANFAEIAEGDNNHALLEFAAVARTATGEAVGTMSKTVDLHFKPEALKQVRESGLDYHGSINVAPGEYTVHFVVEDRMSGRIGSVATTLRVAP